MEGIRTLEYRQEDAEAELRKDAEIGRKAKIAAEVLNDYVAVMREETVRKISTEYLTDELLRFYGVHLQVLRSFSDRMNNYIQRGEIAEEALRNGE